MGVIEAVRAGRQDRGLRMFLMIKVLGVSFTIPGGQIEERRGLTMKDDDDEQGDELRVDSKG